MASKSEIQRAGQSQRHLQVVQLERLAEVEHGKRREHARRDRLLHDLQLSDAELREANPVGRHLEQILGKAMISLASAAVYLGALARLFSLPYQAKVIKRLASARKAMVCSETGRGLQKLHRRLLRRNLHPPRLGIASARLHSLWHFQLYLRIAHTQCIQRLAHRQRPLPRELVVAHRVAG